MDEYKRAVRNIVRQGAVYSNMSVIYLCAKRLADIVASIAGLVILSPVFAVVVLWLKRGSPEPVFVRRQMAGRNGKSIWVYAFRAVPGYEAATLKGRKKNWTLGRLPLLWSVLKGDMSLVGPSPVRFNELARHDFWYSLRLTVKPGLVSLWHITRRENEGFEEMVRSDVKYIKERNFWLDVKILLKAAGALFRR